MTTEAVVNGISAAASAGPGRSLVMRSRTLVVIDRRENGSREEEKVFHLRRGGAVPVDVWGM